jgi:P27 family predicted phage terminase small subunit
MTIASNVVPLKLLKSSKKPLKPPKNLKKAGKKLWESIAFAFELEEHDVSLLTGLCETLDRKNQAEDELKAFGALTFENQYKEKRPHPLVNIIRDCNVLMARLRRELNLSEVQSPSRPPKLKYGGKQYGRT